MGWHDSKADFDSVYPTRVKELRSLSRQFMQIAGSGSSRADYLKRILELIQDWTGCDIVRTVLIEADRRFFGELDPARENPFRFEISRMESGGHRGMQWSSGANRALERMCRDVAEMQCDASKPWITAYGSFFAEDFEKIPEAILPHTGSQDEAGIKIEPDCRSMTLIPVEGGRGRIGLLQLDSNVPGFFTERRIELLERLAQNFGFAHDWRKLQIALRERVKELTCLYGIARLVAHADTSIESVLQNAVDLLPPAWLYPDVTSAKIVYGEYTYATPGADRIVDSIRADIVVGDARRGYIEVGYTVEKPPIDEGPFLAEERNLIDTIASELSFIIEQILYGEERKRLQAQLRRADRLATIGQLAAGVAHELNEPLSNIVGFAQLASKGDDLTDQSKKDLGKIISAALHAREIIKDLLIFSREAEPVKIKFSLNELIKDGLFFLESRFIKAGINLVCDLDPGLPDIFADRSQILQVLTNLAVNSVQAMPNGGRLRIATEVKNDFVCLHVEDSGLGMDKKTVNMIFNPFFTTKDVNEGTGLGLSVVHGIISSHGGVIDVDSRKGTGTRFTIRLPRDNSHNPQRLDEHERG